MDSNNSRGSRTLIAILSKWTSDPCAHPDSPIELPFSIENFCRENDEALYALEAKLAIAVEALILALGSTEVHISKAAKEALEKIEAN